MIGKKRKDPIIINTLQIRKKNGIKYKFKKNQIILKKLLTYAAVQAING